MKESKILSVVLHFLAGISVLFSQEYGAEDLAAFRRQHFISLVFGLGATAVMSVVRMIKTMADAVPLRRSLTKGRMLLGLPPFSKASPGWKVRHTPVNSRSNSSILTLTMPRAGSLMTA